MISHPLYSLVFVYITVSFHYCVVDDTFPFFSFKCVCLHFSVEFEGGNQMSVIPCKLCVKLLSLLVCVTTIFAAAAISLEFEDDDAGYDEASEWE